MEVSKLIFFINLFYKSIEEFSRNLTKELENREKSLQNQLNEKGNQNESLKSELEEAKKILDNYAENDF
jgi:hypothetical protein